MMGRKIRRRMALASVLPVLLVVLAMVGSFWQERVQDLEDAHEQRVGLLAHQVALFGAYDLFSGNTASLQSLVQEIQRQPGVVAVLVFDTDGRLIARSGNSEMLSASQWADPAYIAQQRARGLDVRSEKIVPAVVPMDDLFSTQVQLPPQSGMALGHAVVEFSRQALQAKKRDALLTALWVGAVGLLLGGLLALRLGNWVVSPILRISQMVQRIGRGDFTVVDPVPANDPLQELQLLLNQMANRLAWGREELERQVQEVTQELRLKKEQAENATLAKSRFLAAASHDLRQPSHALGMFVARLGQLPMDAQMRHLVDHLDLSVQALQDLLDGLLDLSRLDAGHVPVRLGPVNLHALLQVVHSNLEGMAHAKGLTLRIRATRAWAFSDGVLLQRMLVNLVINAIRYTERGGVLVACRPQGQDIRIEVWDSGVGIPAEHQDDVFKEFYQLPNRAGDRNFGLGLGLNIVQRSAALLGHQITLRSRVGQGTRFSIRMESAQPQPMLAAENLPPAPGDISGMHILVIEDNAQAREAVQELLQSWGCTVQVAASQMAALHQMQTHGVPDAIVSDYHLGAAENGIECIAALRQQAAAPVPACLMSGDTDASFLHAVKAANLPLLHKPVRPAKLRSLLRHMRM